MRHIDLDFVRVTESAALAASRWIGSGNKLEADKYATNSMRKRLNNMSFSGTIIIGEGEKDKSYGLFSGEKVGLNREISEPEYEIAVDPIEGTTPTVNSGPEAISVIVVAHKNGLSNIDSFYVNKIAYGKEIKNNAKFDINDDIETIINKSAVAVKKEISEFVVCVLDRPRHKEVISKLRAIGTRIKLIQDCDVSGAVSACLPETGVDLLYGIGGSPEAIISAAAIQCLGGGFQCQPYTNNNNNWIPCGNVLNIDELVKNECTFAATGITDGSLLKGVRITKDGAITNSIFMRSTSGTIRWLTTKHGFGISEE